MTPIETVLLIIPIASYAGLIFVIYWQHKRSQLDIGVLKEMRDTINLVNVIADHTSKLIDNNNYSCKIFDTYNAAIGQISKNQRNFDLNIKQLKRELAGVQVFLQDNFIYKEEE